MSEREFEEILTKRLDKIRNVLGTKAKEYVRNGDRLHNFNVGARLDGVSRERVLHGFLLKHYISYMDMLNDMDKGILPTEEYVDEKLGDIINYFILMEQSIKNKIKSKEAISEEG